MNSEQSLIVPIQAHALCVGEEESEQKSSFFSPPTATFASTMPSKDRHMPYISGPSINEPFQTGASIGKGVHLHWFLPDALTRASSETDRNDHIQTVFPVVPNRWLITRVHTRSNAPEEEPLCRSRSWMIESDFLSTDVKYRESANIPCSDNENPYRYMGRAVPLKEWLDQENTSSKVERFKNLTAIGYGNPSFSIYYPHCKNVFAFHDPLEEYICSINGSDFNDDLNNEVFSDHFRETFKKQNIIFDDDPTITTEQKKEKWRISESDKRYIIKRNDESLDIFFDGLKNYSHQSSNLSYIIIGWYDNQKNDPLYRAFENEEVENLLAHFNWAAQEPLDSLLNRTLCCSMITDVRWNAKGDYIQRDLDVSIGLGNTVSGGLAALLAGMGGNETREKTEVLLEACQTGHLNEPDRIDAMADLARVVHRNSFASESGGEIWRIIAKKEGPTDAERETSLEMRKETAVKLDELNFMQAQYDKRLHAVNSQREQAFLDWYKYMLFKYDPDTKKYLQEKDIDAEKFKNFIKPDKNYDEELSDLLDQIDGLRKAVQSQIGSNYEVTVRTAARFFRPNDPVILLAGKDLEPTLRHILNQQLPCVLENQLLPAVILDNKIEISLNAPELSKNSNFPKCVNRLLNELFFLDPAHIRVMADMAMSKGSSKSVNELKKNIKEMQKTLSAFRNFSVSDVMPSSIAVNSWTRPWNPLFMHWRVEYQPIKSEIDEDSKLRRFPSDLIICRFNLSGETIDLKEENSSHLKYESYEGITILTPHAVKNFEELAESFLNKPSEKEISGALERLQKTPVLSQTLSGFHDALIMQKEEMQFPLEEPLDKKERKFHEDMKTFVGEFNQSAPTPNKYFNPVRAGRLKIDKIRTVDTFGQYREISPENIFAAQNLASKTRAGTDIFMLPRLVQPARLTMRWMGTEKKSLETNHYRAIKPFCGWLMPNFLDQSLMIYDSTGGPVGVVRSWEKFRTSFRSYPEKTPGFNIHYLPEEEAGFHKEMGDVIPENSYLKSFVVGILKRGSDYLKAFINTLDRGLSHIEPDRVKESSLSALLTGRPVALLRVALSLDLKGFPVVNQSWASLAHDILKGSGNNFSRDNAGFTEIKFPVRLGSPREKNEYNDGLIGYFRESNDGESYNDNAFYSYHSDGSNECIKKPEDSIIEVTADIKAPPITLLALMDPRARLYATSGILPKKTIDIPAFHYETFYNSMEASFLTSPVLHHQDVLSEEGEKGIDLPLSGEGDNEWLWIGKDGKDWYEKKIFYRKEKDLSSSALMIGEGWLRLKKKKADAKSETIENDSLKKI